MLAEVQSGDDEISRLLRDLATLPMAPSTASGSGGAAGTAGYGRNSSQACSPALSITAMANGEDPEEIQRILGAALAGPQVSLPAVVGGRKAASGFKQAKQVVPPSSCEFTQGLNTGLRQGFNA